MGHFGAVAHDRKDVVREVDNGILLYHALNIHSINGISGDFSIGACPAFIIKNGELVGSPKKMMLSGNIYDLLNNIDSLGADATSQSGGIFGGSTILTPSVLSKCLVIGE